MPFNIALSGIQAASSQLQIAGNNVANASTTGYKQSRGDFADVYAASALGAGSTAIGTGVRLASVSQQFTQGTVKNTDNNLDMAINGQGFFRLSDSGAIVYARAGAFGLDREGHIVNASGQKLTGFQADSTGNITGELGDVQISSANLTPTATSAVNVTLNLQSTATTPTTAWVGTASFGGTAPAAATYNNVTSTTIYDSLGNSHILSTYYIKNESANTWDVRLQVDGVDVYTSSSKSNAITTSAGSLTTSGSIDVIGTDELTINGTAVTAATAGLDITSTSDNAGSAIAHAAAINLGTGTHGVTATANATTLNLGVYTAGTLDATDFSVNGTAIAATTQATLLTALNALTNFTATTNSSSEILLTATNSKNIQVESDGGATGGATFSNFNLTQTLDKTQRSTVSLSSTAPIVIAGTDPDDAGISANTYIAPFQALFSAAGSFTTSTSDTIAISWTPLDSSGAANGATTPQAFTLNLSSSTQFGSPFAVQALTQDGFTTGRLDGINVGTGGEIFGRYTNGQSLVLGQVALANFGNSQGLQSQGDSVWSETFNSGSALVGAPGTASLGTMQSGALENSNVDLTSELVGLIEAQRLFQSNAQTIRTADTVTQTILNIR